MSKKIFLILSIASRLFALIINVPADSPSIQAGIDIANGGDSGLVAPGEYHENINFNGKSIFLSSLYELDADTSHISSTIIDGGSSFLSVVTMTECLDTNSVLNGFTIIGGRGTNIPESNIGLPASVGGGVYVSGGGKVINNRIINNHISSIREIYGGGIYIDTDYSTSEESGIVLVCNNVIAGNTLDGHDFVWGAGLSIVGNGTAMVRNNKISSNSALGQSTVVGGGISIIVDGSVVLSRNVINANSIEVINPIDYVSGGGGLFIWGDSPVIINNVIYDNNAPYGGGIVAFGFEAGFNFRLINNTIADNQASRKGGGLYLTNGHCTAINNIIWGNLASVDNDIYYRGNLNMSYSITEGLYPGDGNSQMDPLFEDDDYHLNVSSPAIDAGNPDPGFFDEVDPTSPIQALWPAMGQVHADIGAYGGNDTVQIAREVYTIQENFLYRVHENMHYRFAYPLDYDSTLLYPLSIILHGAGQWGDDNEEQLYHGLPWRANAEHFGYNEFTLVPQAPSQDWASNNIASVHAIIRNVIDQFPIDTTQIVVIGTSMGGGGTWRLLSSDPDLFCSAIGVAASNGSRGNTKHIPAWLNHGSADQTIGVGTSRSRVEWYESMGLNVVYAEDSTDSQLMDAIINHARIVYSEFEGADHNINKHSFDNYFLFEWLKRQTLPLIRPINNSLSYVNEDSVLFTTTITNPHDFEFSHSCVESDQFGSFDLNK